MTRVTIFSETNWIFKQLLSGVAIILVVSITASTSRSEEMADVKYRGPVNLAPFKCDEITRSSFIQRVCYDARNSYMLINLSGSWYHYCEIDKSTVDSLLGADSMGRYFNASIKGQFDCRTHRVPAY